MGAWCLQLREPDQIVGRGRQAEHPADAGKTTVMGLAKAGGVAPGLGALDEKVAISRCGNRRYPLKRPLPHP
jgi:hypothetical protein